MSGIDKKRIAKNTLMLYIRMAIITIVTLYTSRIVLDILGVEDYGVYTAIGGIVMMLGFLNSAMSSATQRFLSFELGRKDIKQLSKVFSASITIHIIIAVIVVILAETVGLWFLNYKMIIPVERTYAANWVYQLSILTFIVSILSVPYNAMIISFEKMNVFAYISLIEVALKLGLVYILLLTSVDKVIMYAFLMFLSALIIRIICQIYCIVNISESKYKYEWNQPLIRELFAYASWNLFGGIAYIVKTQGINILLNLFWGVFVNAAYAISQQISNAVLLMISNFTIALNPPIVKSYASGDTSSTYNLLFLGMKYSFLLSACLIFPILLSTEAVIYFWLGQTPKYSIVFTQFSLIIILSESIIHPLAAYIQATGKIKTYQSVVGTLLFMILPVSYFALKFVSSPSIVFYVVIIITLISIVIRFIILYKYLKYCIKDMLILCKLIAILSLGNYALYVCVNNCNDDFINIYSVSAMSVLLTVSLFLVFGLGKNEKDKILKRIKTIVR